MRDRTVLRWAVVAVTLLLLFGVIFAAGYFSSVAPPAAETGDARPAVMTEKLYRDGAAYGRKQGVSSYLLMVVNDDAEHAGQVGALYLAMTDSQAALFRILQIDRDCLARVPLRSDGGEITDERLLPLCLAYPLGGGGAQGCENTVLAVSGLLAGVPIDGYAAIARSRLSELRDDVEQLAKLLTGSQQAQDSRVFVSFIRKAMPYLTTDMSESRMLSIADDSYRYGNGGFLSVPGTDGQSGGYDVFLPDEEELRQMVIELFFDMEGTDRNGNQ